MQQGRVSQRYAEALLVAAIDDASEDAVSADLAGLKALIEASADLRMLLKSPVIKREKKRDIFRSMFDGKVNATTLGFLDLLAEKGRESALPFIIEKFASLRNKRMGVLHLNVTSGTTLSGEQQKALQERFADLTQKTISMDVAVDASLRGGFLARIGDTVFDGTIKRQLEILRRRFLEGTGTN